MMKMISEIVSIVLALIVELYFLYTSWQVLRTIFDFQNNEERHVHVFGKVDSLAGIELIRKGKVELRTAYPVYECYIENSEKSTYGIIRYPVELLYEQMKNEIPLTYDRGTGKVWNELEIPILKRELRKRVIGVTLILAVVVIVSKLIP